MRRKCPLMRIGLGGTQSYLNTPGGPRPQWMAGDAGRSFAVRHPCAQRLDPRKHPGKGGFGGIDLRPTAPTAGYGRQPTDAYSRSTQRPKINLNGKLYTEGNFCRCYHKCCDQHEVISRIGVEKWRSSSRNPWTQAQSPQVGGEGIGSLESLGRRRRVGGTQVTVG